MLQDLILDLVMAVDSEEKEKAYRRLEKIGVNRITADAMAAEFDYDRKKDDE